MNKEILTEYDTNSTKARKAINEMIYNILKNKIRVNEFAKYYEVIKLAVETGIISSEIPENLPSTEEEYCLSILAGAEVLIITDDDDKKYAEIKSQITSRLNAIEKFKTNSIHKNR